MTENIVTDRLVLRPLMADDGEWLFPLFNDWVVIEWLSAPPWPYSRADMESFVTGMLSATAPDGEIFRVITRDGWRLGGISTRMRPKSHLQSGDGPNIGFWLGTAHWNRGYMTEAVGGLVRHIFASSPADAIYSGAFTGNTASLRVQSKLGFAREGDTTLRSNPQNADLAHINTKLTRRAFETSNSRKSP